MILKIRAVAEKQGIKNARQLSDKSGINVTSCYQLWNGTAKMISFDVLNTLCNVLQAGPALLLDYTPDAALVVKSEQPTKGKRAGDAK